MDEIRKLLEFDKVVTYIQRKALSPIAEARFNDLPFLTTRDEIQIAQNLVAELVNLLEHDKPFPLELADIREDLSNSAVEGCLLRPEGLIRILKTLQTAHKIYGYLRQRCESSPELWAQASQLQRCREIEESIPAKIDIQTAEVKSNASPKLAQIRRAIIRLEQKTRKALEALFRKYNNRGYLQESVVTLRDGRLVFPVKIENKNKIPGLIHDLSATGSTVFIEPLESLQLNNEVQTLKADEQDEIEHILRELTHIVFIDHAAVAVNFDILCEFDFIQAKAMFAREFNCCQPSLSKENVIEISDGRHPVLMKHKEKASEVVALNISLPVDLKTLVITGPNAGGKSVALKTVGLFALMAQTGIPIPANPDSTLPVFESIFADIGDFQSIENDLSTFSSHVQRITQILEKANAGSLVLIDEIGVGTDPAEGAALSIALLEELTIRGCKTIVTTHHSNLKAYAFETPGVANGSMEFQIDNLEPTYRFKAGIPGSSYALEICARMGLAGNVLARSREILGEDKQRLENLILELERKAQAAEELNRKLESDKIRLHELSTHYEEKAASLKRHENELKEKALAEAEEVFVRANAAIEHVIKEIKEKQASREVIAQAKQDITQQRRELIRQRQTIKQPSAEMAPQAQIKIEIGELVYWKKQHKTGRILTIQEGADKVVVQFDNLKCWVQVDELTQPGDSGRPEKRAAISIQTDAKDTILPEIDVRGCRVDEATGRVDKFLDDALLAGWEQVRIIHGKGTGALRKGIISYLETHLRVKSQKMAAWNEGDLGVTIVELQ